MANRAPPHAVTTHLTATSSPHRRLLNETWQTELERRVRCRERAGLPGYKGAPEHFLFYFDLLIFTLANILLPHLNSTNESNMTHSCYIRITTVRQAAEMSNLARNEFYSARFCCGVARFARWWLPDTAQEVKMYHCQYVFAVCRLVVHPNSRNVPVSVRFCCLSAQAVSQTAEHTSFGTFCCFFCCQFTHTAEM